MHIAKYFAAILLLTASVSLAGQNRPFHPKEGVSFSDKKITVRFAARKQNYAGGDAATRDADIFSPKSVNIHPSGKKYYVNSLEGCSTVVYDFASGSKLKVISHSFDDSDSLLWAPESGLYEFTHYSRNLNTFKGKPVESTFSHGGRYLWVPYYRRSYDINAQDPSAVAVIDTERDSIIRLFETGPLPKMIATSDDGRFIAITHWGDNTVGVMDISSEDPLQWHYKCCLTVDYRLKLNYSLSTSVNRDVGSGYCLRGTVFTPDNRYLLVGCMGGSGGIAVIDTETGTYLGRLTGMMTNLRHLVIKGGYLYISICNKGYIQRIRLEDILEAIPEMPIGKTLQVNGWENCKVPAGARTLVLSPDGRYAFAACNSGRCLAIVDATTMTLAGTVPADPFPVGLDISEDGTLILMTSQAKPSIGGGNAVDIFEVEYTD